jgi:hypothetical protein
VCGPLAAPSQRSALGALFLLLTLGFAGIAFASASAGVWVVAAAAAVIAIWMGGLALRALRPR